MRFRITGSIVSFFTCLVLVAGVAPALSHAGATGVTKERMDAMTHMGRVLKQLRQHLQAGDLMQTPDTPSLILDLKRKGFGIKSAFEVKEIPAMSEASPAIWQDAGCFMQATDMFNDRVEALLQAYETGDVAQTALALKAVSAECTVCHDKYRIEK